MLSGFSAQAMRTGDLVSSELHGRVAIVTGAGGGIGRAHALRLASLGATVVVNDLGTTLDGSGVDSRRAAVVVDEIRALGGEAIADVADIASLAGGRRVVARAIEQFGRVDIVINNAGFAVGGGTVIDPDEEALDRLMDVHLKAAIGTMSAAVPDMVTRGWGRVVNTVSEAALDARFAATLGYGAAKAALWSATLVAASETAGTGVTVNAISPGARTRMNAELLDHNFRGGRAIDLDPAHVANVVAYLLSNDAADINGRVLHAAGGEVREYSTTRTSKSQLVARISAHQLLALEPTPER